MSNATHISQTSLQEITSPEVQFSDHAQARMQQRGIKDSWVALVLEYGRYLYQNGKHSYSISLDHSGIKHIKQKFGDLVELSKLRRLYIILSDDSVVVTCAYR